MTLAGKDVRRIAAALRILFSKAGLEPIGSLRDRAKADRRIDVFSRLIKLDGGRMIGLSDAGLEKLTFLVNAIHDSKIWGDSIEYSDLHNAVIKMVEHSWNCLTLPETAQEVIELIGPRIEEIVRPHTFVFPMSGLRSTTGSSVALGGAFLHDDLEVNLLGDIECRTEDIDALKKMEGFSWLVVNATGSFRRAQRDAVRKASHVAGVLAALAGCTFEGGSSGFRVAVTTSPETSLGHSRWGYWTEDRRHLGINIRFPRGQRLEVSNQLFDRAGGSPIWQWMLSLADKSGQTDLEHGIYRAIYWYGEAHREDDPTLQLIKYWSCVEVFFALTEERISESVANGLSAILRYGPFKHPECPSFAAVKRQAKRLYSLRSRALHQGFYDACNNRDSARFSQLTAWMILSIAGLARRGYVTRADVAAESFRLAALESSAAASVATQK